MALMGSNVGSKYKGVGRFTYGTLSCLIESTFYYNYVCTIALEIDRDLYLAHKIRCLPKTNPTCKN
jgi:hypothetical protein